MSVKIGKKRINFIEAAGRKDVKKDKSKKGKVILVTVPIVILVGVVGVNLFFFVLTKQTEGATNQIVSAMNAPAIADTVSQIEEYHTQLNQYTQYKNQLEAMILLLI